MNVDTLQRVYEELAQRSRRQQQRDIFLVLAADAAFSAGRPDDAERLRQRLLQVNPHSLLRPYASFAEALQSSDVQDYVADLRRLYPPSQAEKLLDGGGNGQNGAPAMYRFQEPEALKPRSAPPEPAPKTKPPRREQTSSPYASYDVPPPAGKSYDSAGSWVALLLFFLVFLGAIGLAVYFIIRPFLT